jgi:hypothetical protein
VVLLCVSLVMNANANYIQREPVSRQERSDSRLKCSSRDGCSLVCNLNWDCQESELVDSLARPRW